MFNGDGTKLVGDDGFLQFATPGATIDGDGATPLPASDTAAYLITEVAGSSGFPAPAYGGTAAAVGDILQVATGQVITPNLNETVLTLNLEDQCDVTSWGMNFTKEEINVTTLCDFVSKYRSGRPDMQGSLAGIHVIGVSDDEDGILRQFIDIVLQDGDNSYDRFEQQDAVLLAKFYTNYKEEIADLTYVYAAVQFFGKGLGGEQGSGQTFEAPFRFTDKTYTDANGNTASITPTYYRLGDGSGT